jgi:hypothetical protein
MEKQTRIVRSTTAKRQLSLAGAIAMSVAAGASTASANGGVLYAADGALSAAGNLYRVDPATALTTTVGALVDASGGAYAISGMAWDPSNNWLWGTTSAASPSLPNGFVRINPATAAVTPIGALGLTPPNFGADLDLRQGVLYGWAESSLSSLMTINTGTGAATVVGPNGQNINTTGSGLASNASGTMFSTPDLATGNVWQVNTGTGQLFGATPLSGGSLAGRIAALEFVASTLYGAELVGDGVSGISSNKLIIVNPVNGAITSVGQFRDATTLEFRRGIDALAIPAPGAASLLGVAMLAATRRRR